MAASQRYISHHYHYHYSDTGATHLRVLSMNANRNVTVCNDALKHWCTEDALMHWCTGALMQTVTFRLVWRIFHITVRVKHERWIPAKPCCIRLSDGSVGLVNNHSWHTINCLAIAKALINCWILNCRPKPVS
jgi:hypothetical protein